MTFCRFFVCCFLLRWCVILHAVVQVKHRMRNREQYQDFLKCLSLFSEDIISKGELLNLVADSLSRHPDLAVHHFFQTLQHLDSQ